MKALVQIVTALSLVILTGLLSSSGSRRESVSGIAFPYRKAGLTERQAAAHLLSRFTFGASPGQVDEVLATGLEEWLKQQLDARQPEDELEKRLAGYDALKMSTGEVVNTFVKPAQLLRMAIKDGIIDKDSVNKADKAAYRNVLAGYMQQKGIRPQRELFRQLADQKILRAVYANNQLQEVLTDFWFNHFNVSLTKNDCAEYVSNYERDVIRPHVLGKFEELLLSTAHSPAMLLYLDNFSSAGVDSSLKNAPGARRLTRFARATLASPDSATMPVVSNLNNRKQNQGLNENYAREVMELHTMGVDGGYTQSDVTQAARVLTGWTVYPTSDYGGQNAIRKLIDKIGEDKLAERGFVHDGDFLFAANRHDNREKVVLGKTFKAGGGYEEGLTLLKMLAHHPSTAKFICRKIAVRFVNDNPSPLLVAIMAKTFLEKDGDTRAVLLTMVSSPEFWTRAVVRDKTKSPFELAVSTARSVRADVKMPFQLYNWVDKMGQKLYYYQAPTGYPDNGQYWINTGALLNRMNFGLAFASQRIPGIKMDLLALNQGHEPESAEAALATFGKIMMPERDLAQTVKHLTPLLHDPMLQQKLERKAAGQPMSEQSVVHQDDTMQMDPGLPGNNKGAKPNPTGGPAPVNSNMLAQVVGIIIGSPEFQRR